MEVLSTPRYPFARDDAVWLEEVNYMPLLLHHDQMNVLERRINSFYCWPNSAPDMRQIMADNGLYYTGIGDIVKCFHCGKELSRWTTGQCPKTRHLEKSPKCDIARGSGKLSAGVGKLACENGKESSFSHTGRLQVDGCVPSKKRVADVSSDETIEEAKENEERSRREIITKTVRQLGFSEEDVEEASKLLADKKKKITTNSLIDTIYDIQKEREEIESRTEKTKKTSIGCEQSTALKQDKFPSKVAGASDSKCTSLLKAQVEKEKHRLENLIKHENVRRRCCVCQIEPATTLYLPCAHKVACAECTRSLSRCPVESCRKVIRGTKQVFYA